MSKMNKIQLLDLSEQYRRLKAPIDRAIQKVLSHGQFIMGPEVQEFEKKLAAYAGVRRAVSCSSGTDALLMVLMARDIGPGDAVFTTPFTFVATAEVIARVGATPVFVDIDPVTRNLDAAKLIETIDQVRQKGGLRPRAVIPVDLFGIPADYKAFMSIAKRAGLFVLEDAAQSFGAVQDGKRAGSLGHAAALSFFPAKPFGCYGDGGAVLTDDEEIASLLESIRVHGQGRDRYENVRLGLTGRLDTIQAAVLNVKLEHLDEELEARSRCAAHYDSLLSGVVETPRVPGGCRSAWAQYSIESDKRDRIINALKENGVPCAVYYPVPLHLQKVFSDLGHRPGDFPAAEKAARRIVSLPLHPYLSEEDVEYIAGLVASAVS